LSESESGSDYCLSESENIKCDDNLSSLRSDEEDGGMKFITFFTSLKILLRFCLLCNGPAKIDIVYSVGTALCVKLICDAGHSSSWSSQPEINQVYLGNLLTTASIVFGGSTYAQFQSIALALRLKIMSKSTFFRIQKKYIFPTINFTYKVYQRVILDDCLKNQNLEVSGDGRCDSPGYSAKYGTYSIMDESTSKVIHFHVVSAKETTSSNAMELYGLKKVIEKMNGLGIKIGCFTTDDHQGIKKYLKSSCETTHQLDIWHKGKNIKKKLTKAAKQKDCNDLNGWIKSIINHFWWCSATCKGDEEVMREKWLSILCHVSNIHDFPKNKHFKKCLHSDIVDRNWLIPGSPTHNKLSAIIKNKRLLNDMIYFTKFKHTGNLEVFHSLLLKYCPKRLHFTKSGMIARTQLAVMHFNGIISNKQAITKDGVPRYKYQYSRITQSMVIKPIKVEQKKVFIDDLLKNLFRLFKGEIECSAPKIPELESHETNELSKHEAILAHRSRFNIGKQ